MFGKYIPLSGKMSIEQLHLDSKHKCTTVDVYAKGFKHGFSTSKASFSDFKTSCSSVFFPTSPQTTRGSCLTAACAYHNSLYWVWRGRERERDKERERDRDREERGGVCVCWKIQYKIQNDSYCKSLNWAGRSPKMRMEKEYRQSV